jgi:O-glycosyl hydrolase
MNRALVALVILGVTIGCGVAQADDRGEIAAGVASCVNAAMEQGHRSQAFSVAYCRCLIPQMVQAMPASLKTSNSKQEAQGFASKWLEDNPVVLGACLKTGEVAEKKS